MTGVCAAAVSIPAADPAVTFSITVALSYSDKGRRALLAYQRLSLV